MKLAIPEKLTRSETILLSLLLVAVLAIGVLVVVPWLFPSISHTEPEVGATLIDVERQKPLNTKFDLGVFTDPRWKPLKRISAEPVPGTLGRPNPFAPLEEVPNSPQL